MAFRRTRAKLPDLWLIAPEIDTLGDTLGGPGSVLTKALGAAGLRRASVRLAPLDGALEALRRAKPKLTIALGDEAAEALLGEAWPRTRRGTSEGSLQTRGYLWDTPTGRVMTCMHPKDVIAGWTPWRALFALDFRKAARELQLKDSPLPEKTVTICTDPSDVEELWDAMRDTGLIGRVGRGGSASRSIIKRITAQSGAPPMLAVDIENTEDLKLACCGFAPSENRAWVIPAGEPWQIEAIKELCESGVPKVLQNGAYDRFFLRRFSGINLRNQVFDSYLAWHSYMPELAGKKVSERKVGARRTVKSLKFLSSVFSRERYWKNYDFASEDERYRLCGIDCCVTLEIARKLRGLLEAA